MYSIIKLFEGILSRLTLLCCLNCCLVAYGQNIGATTNASPLKRSVYFPLPESQGGWRTIDEATEQRRQGIDSDKLVALKDWLLASDNRDFAAVLIHKGSIVLQVERNNSASTDARRVASVSKAICATVLAIASEQSQQGKFPRKMKFDDRAFDFIPWAQPLSDPRKQGITVKQLLNHTSGISPEAVLSKNSSRWEEILGHTDNSSLSKLAFDPGTASGYSSHAFFHAALVCETVTGKPYDQFAIDSLFKPIGCEHWWFQEFEGGEKIGKHPSHGMGMPARDLARVAYCMLRDGRWRDEQVIPRWFVDETARATHSVQGFEMRFKRAAQSFSHGWELPAMLGGPSVEEIPSDARFKPGSGGQLIAFVPSLDLVVTRQTGSSGAWEYEEFLRRACDAIIQPSQPVFIDTSFENASPVWYESTANATAIYLLYDHERNSSNRAAGHLHIRLETQAGSRVALEFRNLDNIYNGRPGSVAKEMHSLVVSEDGKRWRSVPTIVSEHSVRLEIDVPGGQLYIARVEPYRLSDLDHFLDTARVHPEVNIETIGKTVEGRPLEIMQVGNPLAPHHVFLRARAHAWEAGGNWILEGLVGKLLRENEKSKRCLSECCLWIMPMANKDAVARGRTRFNSLGKDLNRNWDAPADAINSPENHALERWLEARLNSGKRIHFALELHNDGNGQLHLNSPPDTEKESYFRRMNKFEDLLRKHTWFSVGSTKVMHGTGTLANGWQNRYGIDGAVHEFNCQWIEKLNEPPLAKHWIEYGEGLTNVLSEYFE